MPETAVYPGVESPATVEYPCSDGRIMAETRPHVEAIVAALTTLENCFRNDRWVHVGANMFVYYQEGDPSKRLTPDLFVVRGLPAPPQKSYRIWELGRPPTFVLEVASPSTQARDGAEKQALYASMGVPEYWRFDPNGRLVGARRAGARLEGGRLQGFDYESLEERPDGSIRSEVLELDVRVDDRPGKTHLLRFRDPLTDMDLLTFWESEECRLAAEEGRQAAEKGRQVAEEGRRQEKQMRLAAEQMRLAVEKKFRESEQNHRQEVARLRDQIASLAATRNGGPPDDRS